MCKSKESSSVEDPFFPLIPAINHDNGAFILKQSFQKRLISLTLFLKINESNCIKFTYLLLNSGTNESFRDKMLLLLLEVSAIMTLHALCSFTYHAVYSVHIVPKDSSVSIQWI